MRSFAYGKALAAPRTGPGHPAAAGEPANNNSKQPSNALQRASDSLLEFVPTDVVAPYLPAMGLAFTVRETHVWVVWLVYALGLVVSTFLVGHGYLSTRTAQTPAPRVWTWIKLAAPVVAFAIWGLAVPGLFADPVHTAVVSIVALFISPMLKKLLPKTP